MRMLQLADPAATRRFYEQRYANGYMDVWDDDRHARLCDVLATIDLPPGASVLDFGCGSGGLTRVLRERWPDAEVHGADISDTAVRHAGERVPGAVFHRLDDAFVAERAGHFDLVFSHHVLEHAFDLDGTLRDLRTLTRVGGRMLHALPCGNAGSLAHWLCEQRPDGIDAERGGRFFFEEESHLRRLRSDQLLERLAAHDFAPRAAAFGYHWIGVLRLLTEMTPPLWLAILNPLRCRAASRPLVFALLLLVATLAALRAPAQVLLRTRRRLRQVFRLRTRRLLQPGSLMLLTLAGPSLLLAPFSLPCEWLVRRLDEREWRRRRHDPRGSEMFLEVACTRQPVVLPRERREAAACAAASGA